MTILTTGPEADAYADQAFADAYAQEHFVGAELDAWDAAEPNEHEAALRQGAQYIDSQFRERFPGRIRSTSQALEWPRVGAYDRSGRNLNGIPVVVQQANVELAKERLLSSTSLVPTLDRGGFVKRKRLEGVAEIEYADEAPGQKLYRFAAMLLSAVLDGAGHRVRRV